MRLAAIRHVAPIKAAVKASLQQLPDLIPDRASRYARAGEWKQFTNAIDWNHFSHVLEGAFAAISKARQAGADIGVGRINAAFRSAGKTIRYRKVTVRKDNPEYAFDLYDDDLLNQLRDAQDDLIAQLSGTARDTIEFVIENGLAQNLGPDQVVDDIRSVITLTSRQAQAVMNYRDMLEDLDETALERRLRNTALDDDVRDAIDSGEFLPDDVIDQLTQDYTDNYLDYRADTIAQTESSRAINSGLQDAYQQAIDRGVFPSDAVRQHWKIALDEKTCAVCRSIPDLNPDGVAMDEAFESDEGPVDAPPDPHPSCRCEIEIVTNLDMLPAGTAGEDNDTEDEAA